MDPVKLMTLKEQFTRHALLPLHERLRGRDTLQEWKRFRANDQLSPESFHELRLTKLRQLLQHCAHHVPYYREVFEQAGITDPDHCDLQDLQRLPILERSILRHEGARLITEGWQPRLIRYSTGGSTGEPLVFYTDKHRESCLNAQKLR
ncbi:MAG: phenylacetate--CoA ligase family protein, partial [Pseudomonadota bacterium]